MPTSVAEPFRIRLVRRDKKLIELDCTNYQFSITRALYHRPVPFTGERAGADLNIVECDVRMECILSDDDCTEGYAATEYSYALIDFSTSGEIGGTADDPNLLPYMEDDGGAVSDADLDESVITVLSADDTEFKITLSDTLSTEVDGNDITINIAQSDGNQTAAYMVSKIYTALTTTSGSQVYTNFQAQFEVTKGTGTHNLITGDTQLKITQKTAGSVGRTAGPIFTNDSGLNEPPMITQFSVVSDTLCYSAGDKVQNLIGTVANNTILGFTGDVGSNSLWEGATEGLLHTWGDHDWSFNDANLSDYIVGLQLPYNSLAEITDAGNIPGTPQGYNARNFLIVTGANIHQKGADSNTERADIPFDIADKYTGISGTVTGCDITYDAGETIYRATITFQPLDLIGGI